MVKIGEQIQSLRKQYHVTQSDLANAVGVTTQAVSKWERGGTPDAELLPAIADYFKVSIDQLYGRSKREEQNLSSYVYDQLRKVDKKQRALEAFRINYAMNNACSNIDDLASIMENNQMQLYEEETMRVGYLMTTDESMAVMSLMKKTPYSMFMPEPADGYLSGLMSICEYEEFFVFLSKPFCLKILFQLFQRKNGFTIPLLAKLLEVKEHDILPLIEEMVERKWLSKLQVDTEEGTMPAYLLENYAAFLPFLLITQDMCLPFDVGYAVTTREKPILYHNENVK